MNDVISIQCFITGKVQGVWFRANTKKEAERLGITGYAKNLNDGRVEVVAVGEREYIDVLFLWLQHGPALAVVEDVTYEEIDVEPFDNFDVI